jgi:hypothetical protein
MLEIRVEPCKIAIDTEGLPRIGGGAARSCCGAAEHPSQIGETREVRQRTVVGPPPSGFALTQGGQVRTRHSIAAGAALVVAGTAMLVLAGSVTAGESALPVGNLVKNPGAETPVGLAVQAPDGTAVNPVGWENEEAKDPTGQPSKPVQSVRYGSHQFVLKPAVSSAIGGGRSFFNGGYPSGITKAFQVIDVSRAAADIDAGGVKACASAYLGGGLEGAGVTNAVARLDVELLGEDDSALGRLALGPVTQGHRKGAAVLLRRASERPVPAGTRKLRALLTLTASYPSNNAMADNISVALVKKDGSCDPVLAVTCKGKALVATVQPSTAAPAQRVRFAVKGGKRTKQAVGRGVPSTSRFTMDGLTGRLTVTATVTQRGSGNIVLTKKSKRC